MSEIPTTAQIRTGFTYLPNTSCAMHLSTTEAAKFDRWLAEHDAQIRADERAKIAAAIRDEKGAGNEFRDVILERAAGIAERAS